MPTKLEAYRYKLTKYEEDRMFHAKFPLIAAPDQRNKLDAERLNIRHQFALAISRGAVTSNSFST